MEDIRFLKQKRTSLKQQITLLKNFFERDSNSPDLVQLKLRLDRLKTLFEAFEDYSNQLEILEPEGNHSEEKGFIIDAYFDLAARIHRVLEPPFTRFENTEINNSSALERSILSAKRRIKLPQISLPKFTGKYEEWLPYKNSFISMIHNDKDLSNLERFQYLKSTVIGDAAKKIDIFPLEDENYVEAWNLLVKSYENKRVIISRHLSLLLGLPHVKEGSYEDLSRLADQAQQHVKSLSHFGVNVNSEIIVQILEERLPRSIANKWDETLKRDVFPKLDDLIEFIYGSAARLSVRNNFKISQSSTPTNSSKPVIPHKRKKYENKNEIFVTTIIDKCAACSEKTHPLFRCNKFKEMTVFQRIKLVNEAKLCKKCLRAPINHNCKFGTCMVCKQRHNTLLHITKTDPKRDKNL